MSERFRANTRLPVVCTAVLAILLAGSVVRAQSDPFAEQNDLFGIETEPLDQAAQITSFFSVSSAAPGKTYSGAIVIALKPGWHINSASPYQDWLIPAELTFDTVPGLTPFGVSYPQGIDAAFLDERISVYADGTIIRFETMISGDAAPGEYVLPVRFTYQPCDEKVCRSPATIDVPLRILVGEEGAPVNTDVFGIHDEQAGQTPPSIISAAPPNELQRLIDEHGFWGYFIALALAFVTGLLLSFSPCTYPMIPITVSVFAGQERNLGRGFILSLFYVGSMATMYGAMGLVVSLVGGVFGAWLASTPVVIGIAVVFVIFALSMFGLYELQVPASLRARFGSTTGGGGVFGSIILGVVAALVVSPCVGPFVAGILIYVAASGSPVLGFLVLFVFALGLGTLFVIIATFSSALSALPGAGGWMESIKRFFGFVLLVMALYFLRTIIPAGITAVLAGLLLVAFGVFGGGMDRLSADSGFFPRLRKLLGILALLAGAYLLIGSMIIHGLILPPASEWLPAFGSQPAGTESHLIDWQTDLDAGMSDAAEQRKPVLVDTWATWCINCRILERKTFGNPQVALEAKRFAAIKVQLENSQSQTTRDFMARFGLKHFSLPTTLIIDRAGNVRHIMQGVIEPADMLAKMKQVE